MTDKSNDRVKINASFADSPGRRRFLAATSVVAAGGHGIHAHTAREPLWHHYTLRVAL